MRDILVLATLTFPITGWSPASAQEASCAAAPQTAVEFAPHLADSTRLFRGQFSADGRELYYFKKVTPGKEDYRIYVSRLENGAWSPPVQTLMAGEVSELYPTITPDDRRLIFSSYQPVPGDTATYKNAHLFMAEREGSRWGTPVLQRAASRIGWYHSGPMIGPDNALYFGLTSPDWRTFITMRSEWNGDEYGPPQPFDDAERWGRWRSDSLRVWGAQPTPMDSVMLVYASTQRPDGGTYNTDIYATFRRAGGWTEPQPLGAGVNTRDGAEGFAFFSPDGCRFLFTRDYSRFYHVSLAAAMASARQP